VRGLLYIEHDESPVKGAELADLTHRISPCIMASQARIFSGTNYGLQLGDNYGTVTAQFLPPGKPHTYTSLLGLIF
jgi:hypothetical protein